MELSVLKLEDPRWSQLRHAYGAADDIPNLLKQLEGLPSSEGDSEPWFSLWSALAHQGDVYSASFAAVPHVVRALARAPERADYSYFQFPAWVEICRAKTGAEIPKDLEPAYLDALSRLPELIGVASRRPWESGFLACALAALPAAKGQPGVAEAALELTPEVADEFLEWQLAK
jgi:hypothetical protein